MRIEKSIPAPMPRSRKYPFHEMDVGDSIFFDGARIGSKEYEAAKKYFERNGKKMRVRTAEGGLRIWRVE